MKMYKNRIIEQMLSKKLVVLIYLYTEEVTYSILH